MIKIEYKILFELRIVHDYYLIDNSGGSAFSLPAIERNDLLQARLRTGRYDLQGDFDFFLNRKDLKKLRDYRIKFIKTPLGFFAAMEVESEEDGSGNRRYRPFIPPPSGAYLAFGLNAVNPLIGNITELHLGNDDSLTYYFSNAGAHDNNALASPVPLLVTDGSRNYLMGELAQDPGGDILQALEDNDGSNPAQWGTVTGNGFVHRGDRSLDTNDDWYKTWLLERAKPGLPPMGIIQFFFNPADPGLKIIGDDGYLITQRDAGQPRAVHPVFELRFLSRRSYWRYQRREGFEAGEAASIQAAMSDWLEDDGGRFVTKTPRYLAQALTGFLPVSGPSDPVYFTNPAPNALKKESGRLYSDVFFTKANPIPL
ncbi:MAG: hypothetical protein KF852_03295 [Saprospiraceae bacterium]|nr:hypothetical protein [Saprospiraceae bacterium]